MAKMIKCADLGNDCGFEAKAETMEELMGMVAKHAKDVHGLASIPPEVVEQAKAVIRDI